MLRSPAIESYPRRNTNDEARRCILIRSLRRLARSIASSIGISLLPLILNILIPIVQLLRHSPLRALSSLHLIPIDPPSLLLRNAHALTQLQIPLSLFAFGQFIARHNVVVLVAAAALEHAPVVPAAGGERERGADDVGEDVEGVEVAVVGEEGLQDFGADCEEAGDYQQGQVD